MNTSTRWWTFGIVSLALFMGMLDNLVVTTALPAIHRALHASISDLEWTVNAYTLVFTIMMIPAATLGDRYGRRRFLVLGVALFTLGSAASALSSTAAELSLARALQGLGGAFITPLTLPILLRVFPSEQRAAAIGLWSGVSGLGLAMGPLIGGAIVNGLSWNAVFWINVPIGLLLIVLARLGLQESQGAAPSLDLPGMALVGAGLLGIVYGLIRGNDDGWSSPSIVASLAGGVVLVAAFLWREGRTRFPLLDLRLFRSRGFTVANSVGFLMSFGMFGSIWLLTLFMQEVQGASPLRAGLETMPWTGTIMVVAPVAGILAGRVGARPLVLAGMAAQAGALAWIGSIAEASTPYASLLPAFILGGIGMGLSFAPLSAAIMGSVADVSHGQASGAYNTIRELGGVFGVAVLGAVFQHVVVSPQLFLQGIHTAVLAGSAVLGAGVVVSIWLPSTQPTVARTGALGQNVIIADSAQL